MCGALNAVAEHPSELPTPEEIGKTCILCGFGIFKFEPVHRSADGEVVHKACHNNLYDEDAHFYEQPEEAV